MKPCGSHVPNIKGHILKSRIWKKVWIMWPIDFNEFDQLVIWNDQNYGRVDISSIDLQEPWPMQCWINVIDVGWYFIKGEPSKFGIFNWILPWRWSKNVDLWIHA